MSEGSVLINEKEYTGISRNKYGVNVVNSSI